MSNKVYRMAGHGPLDRVASFTDNSGRTGDWMTGPSRGQGARHVNWKLGVQSFTGETGWEAAPGDWIGAVPEGTTEMWSRSYFYFESYPDQGSGDGQIAILDFPQSHWGLGEIFVTIDYAGRLKVYSHNGLTTYEVLCQTIPGAMLRNQWVRVECRVKQNTHTTQTPPNPPFISNAVFELKVNGTLAASYYCSDGDPGQVTYGIHEQGTYGVISVSRYGFRVGCWPSQYNIVGSCLTGFVFSYDDHAFGIDGWIGEGYVTDIFPESVASEGWGIQVGVNDELLKREYRAQYSSDTSTTTIPNDILVLNMPRLRSKGITTPTRLVEFLAFGDITIASPGIKFGISINGGAWVDYQAWNYSYSQGWAGARSQETINPDDDVQIRLIKDNNTTERNVTQIGLCVESQSMTQYVPDQSIGVKTGTYVGNGGQQRIDLDGFVPDLLIISQTSGTGQTAPIFFSKTLRGGTYPPWSPDYGVNYNANGLCRFDDDGFTIYGNTNTFNASGVTFSVIAIHDPSMIAFFRGVAPYQHNNAIAYRMPSSHATFVADLILTKPCRIEASGSTGLFFGKGYDPGYASLMDGTPTHNLATLITSIEQGGWTYGTGSPVSAISTMNMIFAVRDIMFQNYTMGLFSYTGNGVNSATISFPAPYDTLTPAAMFVFETLDPSSTGIETGQYKGPGFDNVSSKAIYGTSLRTNSMGPFGVGYFTAGTDGRYVNGNGVRYSVLVFFETTDSIPRTHATLPDDPTDGETSGPGPCNATWGCDWSPSRDEWSFDWPDLVPGLLGVNFGVRRFNAIGTPADLRSFKVNCEQRTFPVEAETREFDVTCEQRTFQAVQE
jgi:hypothetical protein